MTKPLVYDLKDVSYKYNDGKFALYNMSLNITKGEKIVLLGPNGCGKSTLQKMLAGLIFPSEGSVSAFGTKVFVKSMRDKTFAATFRRKVGFVMQNSDVQLFCSCVLDEIMFGPLAMGMSNEQARQRAQDLMDYLDISFLKDRLPQHLSGGEKKKVSIAAVLAVNPEVLILDEPTNGLDPRTQRFTIDMINELNDQGKTLITATHHLELVPELANRVVVLGENHQIIADGTPESILDNRELLLAANLIDERYHLHRHGQDGHVHVHRQYP